MAKLPFELQKRHLLRLGERLCVSQDLDPVIAVQALDVIDPTLTYAENKRIYLEELARHGVKVSPEEEKVGKWEEQMLEAEAGGKEEEIGRLESVIEELKERIRELEKRPERESMTKDEAERYLLTLIPLETFGKYRKRWEEWWEDIISRAEGREAQKKLIERVAEYFATVEEARVMKEIPETVAMGIAAEYEPPSRYRDFFVGWMTRYRMLQRRKA